MKITYFYKKFKADLVDTRQNSSKFDLALHLKMWISEYILRLDTVNAGYMWTSYPLHQFLHSLNLKNKNILEFGSGGSTVFFLKRKANLITFEHSQIWIEKLRLRLENQSTWQPYLVEYICRQDDQNGYLKYIEKIQDIEDETLDIALVDGRHRVECVRAVQSKLVPGGKIILDDSDRPSYQESYEILKNWETFRISGYAYMSDYKTHSTVWQKPS
jgi:hypothetical protein